MHANKLDWISGIKGVACLVVATNHVVNLFPGLSFPLAMYNGGFAVNVFILLSAILACISALRRLDKGTSEIECARWIVSRYIRIFIPVLLITLLTILGYYAGAFNAYQTAMTITGGGDSAILYTSEIMTIKHAVKVSLLAPVKTQNHIVFPIWMLPYIFWGSIISFIKCLLIRQMNYRAAISFLLVSCLYECFVWKNSIVLLYSIGIFIGYMLYYHRNFCDFLNRNVIVNVVGLSLFVCGFVLSNGLTVNRSYFNPQIVGAVFIVFGVFLSGVLQNIFSMRILVRLGDISMGIYYIHQPITTSICCFLYLYLVKYGNEQIASIIMYISYILLIIIFAHIYTAVANRLTKKIQIETEKLLFG